MIKALLNINKCNTFDRFLVCVVNFVRKQLLLGTAQSLQCHAITYLSFHILYALPFIQLLYVRQGLGESENTGNPLVINK